MHNLSIIFCTAPFFMEENKEISIIKILKFVFSVIAIISLVFVGYNIGLYTNDQDIEAFADLE